MIKDKSELKTNLWQKIIIMVLVLVFLILGIEGFLYWDLKNKQSKKLLQSQGIKEKQSRENDKIEAEKTSNVTDKKKIKKVVVSKKLIKKEFIGEIIEITEKNELKLKINDSLGNKAEIYVWPRVIALKLKNNSSKLLNIKSVKDLIGIKDLGFYFTETKDLIIYY